MGDERPLADIRGTVALASLFRGASTVFGVTRMDWTVNGLTLPALLISLIQQGRWLHPGDGVMLAVIPFLRDPVDFLDLAGMRLESSGRLADHPDSSALFHEV